MTHEETDQQFIMKLQELKRDMDTLQFEPKSEETLRRMMYASVLSRLTGFRVRPIKENLVFLGKLLLLVAATIFFKLYSDPTSAVFAAWSLLALIDEYIGIRYLYFIKYQDTIEKSLKATLAKVKRITLVSRLVHIAIWGLIIFIAASTTTAWNTVLTALLTLPLLVVVSRWTSKKWTNKITEVKAMLHDIADDGPRGTMAVE